MSFIKAVIFIVAIIICGRLLNRLFPAKAARNRDEDDSPIIDVPFKDAMDEPETDQTESSEEIHQ